MPASPLPDIAAGADVFLDANIFVYGLCGNSAQCKAVLERCAREELLGVTTLEVVAEATHRLMLAEACYRGLITRERVILLRKKLQQIRDLTTYWRQAEAILSMNILILQTEQQRHREAQEVRSSHGILTNDSLIVATMRQLDLTALASADSDFDHIPYVTRYEPKDLPPVS